MIKHKLVSICLKIVVFILLSIGIVCYFEKCSNTYKSLGEAEEYALMLAEQEHGEKFSTTSLHLDHDGQELYGVVRVVNETGMIRISYGILLEDMTVVFVRTETGVKPTIN